MVSTMARWTESDSLRRNSGVVPLRRAMRTSGMPVRCPALRLGAQVERLAPRDAQEAVLRQRHALAGVLHAGPREHRIEVVAAVHEDRPRRDLRPDAEGALLVARAVRGGQAGRAVVHQADGLVVVG